MADGPNLHALGLLDGKGPSKTSEPPKDVLDVLVQAFSRALGGALKITGLSSLSKLGEVSVFAQVTTEGISGKSINMVNFDVKGGALAEALMGESGLNIGRGFGDFSKVVSAAVEPMVAMCGDGLQGTHVSYGDLGGLHSNAPGRMDGGGLSLG